MRDVANPPPGRDKGTGKLVDGDEHAAADMISAAIIDDHPLARRGIAQILDESGRITVVAQAASAAELLDSRATALTRAPDVVICDLYHADDKPCLDAVAALVTEQPTIVVSASGRPGDVIGAIRAGACGYVTKHADPAMIIAAVETAAAGGFALSPHLADILYAQIRPVAPLQASPTRSGPGGPKLSPREEEALSLIADGFTHAQVARRMGVTKATVETYVERIRAKLQVGNKADLTRAALTRVQVHG